MGADYRVGSHHAPINVGQVHGAALAAHQAALVAHEFAQDARHRGAPRQRMCMTPIGAEIIDTGDLGRAAAPKAAGVPAPTTPPATPAAPVVQRGATPANRDGHGAPLSPAVRKLLAEHGVDIARIRGTGRDGRVKRDDVLSHLERRQTAPATSRRDAETVRFSPLRKRIAEHMVRSKATSAHVLQARVPDMARAIARIAARARSNALKPDDMTEGTYSLTNNGSFGTFITAPIINQPQIAILSIDGVQRRPWVVADNDGERIDIRPVGMLAHSFDHRAVDGAYSGAYLRLVKQLLESHEWMGEFLS